MIGSNVVVIIDRKLGSSHPEFNDMIYPVNYGYIDGIIAPDGEFQDAYILGVEVPINRFEGKVIAVVKRRNDIEDKWVVAKESIYSKEEIMNQIMFTEQFFDSIIEM